MPRLGLHPRQFAAVRAKKSEARGIGLKPLRKRCKRSRGRELRRRQLDPIARADGVTVDEIHIRPPVVAAGPGEGRPLQNGGDALGRRQPCGVEQAPRRVVDRRRTAVFRVPDRELAREIAKTTRRHQVEAGCQRRPAQIQERRHHVRVQRTRRIGHVDYVAAHDSGQLARRHGANSRAAAYSATWSMTFTNVSTSWAPEMVYWRSKMNVGTPVMPSTEA